MPKPGLASSWLGRAPPRRWAAPRPRERALRTQPPGARRHRRSQAQRTCCVQDSGGVRCPRPPLPPCLDRHDPPPDLCLRTPREPGAGGESVRSARKNLGRQPSAKSFSYSLPLGQILTRGGERRGTGDRAPLGARSAEKAHLAPIRPSVAFFHRRTKRVPFGSELAAQCPQGPSTANPSLQLQHQRLDSATARPRLGRVPARGSAAKQCALADPGPRAGGQEVRQGSSKGRGAHFPHFTRGLAVELSPLL